MNNIIYNFKEIKDDGTIIYDKFLIDTDKYDIIVNNNQLILKPKPTIIKIKNLEDFDRNCENFRGSIILSCFVNGKRPSNNNYFSILKEIYNIIGSGKIIIKNTLMNIETVNRNYKGFKYLENLGISVQHKDAINTFIEILNQCTKNRINLNIEIEFINKNKITYLIE